MTALIKSKSTFILSIILLGAFVVSPVLAVGKPVTDSVLRSMPPKAQLHLADAKLKSCEARETAIKTRAGSLNRLSTSMLEKFAAIAKRVQDYYTASGTTVATYDTLVTTIATKKAAVQAALTAAETDVAGFDCSADDPKAHMTQYQKDMKAVKAALKEYRTSIKNLIVAVRSVTGKGEVDKSPKPSKSPKASPSNQGEND